MTNKEKYLEEAIKRIKYYNTDEPLKIVKVPFYTEEINALCDYFTQPTFDECIKEWEKRGFAYENNDKRIYFANKKENILIYIQKELKNVTISVVHYNYTQTITYDLHNLIHKTLKALEEMKDGN